MTEPGNGQKRKQAEALLYDLHEIVWDDAVSLLMRILARAEAAEARVAYLESLMGGRASTILLAAESEP